MRLPTAMAASLLILALSAGCEQGSNDDAPPPVVAPSTQPAAPPAPEAPETPEPEAPPSPDIDENLACARHDECRLLEGVCGSPAPSSSTGADATRREIEARARITTCGVAGIGVDDATPACIEGACSVLLGPPADRRCAADSDCVVSDGLCGTTEAVRRDARAAFDARVGAWRARGLGCGYGDHPEVTAALCDDGLCVGRADDT